MKQVRKWERLAGTGAVACIAGVVFFVYDVWFQSEPSYYVQIASVSSVTAGYLVSKKSLRKMNDALESETLKKRYSD